MWLHTFYNKFHQNKTVVIAKYIILLWMPHLHIWETIPFGEGQEELFKRNCDFKNCYFTRDIHFFGKSLEPFDAVIFSGIRQSFEEWFIKNLPKQRFLHQKYIFLSAEPSELYPLCSKAFDNFFNWTYTYKLDSDCVIYYIKIKTKEGRIIYPKKNMHWVNVTTNVSESFKNGLRTKTKAIAWLVSHCKTNSKREAVYHQLQKELFRYNITIDVYGICGNLKCSTLVNYRDCYDMLEKEYYFYLAFENSICEDYVSEKVLHALLNKVVPIVYGGADYSRFLPPGSYLNIHTQNLQQIALTVKKAMSDLNLYASFFKWTNYYSFVNNGSGVSYSDVDVNICQFCKLMNDKEKFRNYSTIANMRDWWLPEYKKRCNLTT